MNSVASSRVVSVSKHANQTNDPRRPTRAKAATRHGVRGYDVREDVPGHGGDVEPAYRLVCLRSLREHERVAESHEVEEQMQERSDHDARGEEPHTPPPVGQRKDQIGGERDGEEEGNVLGGRRETRRTGRGPECQ